MFFCMFTRGYIYNIRIVIWDVMAVIYDKNMGVVFPTHGDVHQFLVTLLPVRFRA